MNQRERLIGWIMDSVGWCGRTRHWAEIIADGIMERGGLAPPCKVGDVVYSIGWLNETVKEEKILYFKYNSYLNNFVFGTDMGHFDENQIGKFIFLNREAAEQALKEHDKE